MYILNEREKEIFDLLSVNTSNKEMAELLCMSVAAIKWNLQNIYRKLGLDIAESGGKQAVRRQAMLYAGSDIATTLANSNRNCSTCNSDKTTYSIAQIRSAAFLSSISADKIDDLISFLEM